MEAHIDFAPDEVGEYNPQDLLPQVEKIKNKLSSLCQSYENGLKIRSGLKIVLCGKPNAGKSSLYNALLKSEKAIVTNIPGTTRDVLEEKVYIESKEFVLLDTAGLRESEDAVEKIGVERTLKTVDAANIICYVIDGSLLTEQNYKTQIQSEIQEFLSSISFKKEQKLLLVLNKKDLMNPTLLNGLSNITHFLIENSADLKLEHVLISQHDFSQLTLVLLNIHNELHQKINLKETPMVISQRQKDKVTVALDEILLAQQLIAARDFPEKIASLFNFSKASLEEIIGDISVDTVFEKVFSSFCIGK